MGVMSCSRKECENIMCDLYIPIIGYICHECKGEFMDQVDTEESLTEAEIVKKLQIFMETQKFDTNRISISDFFNKHE